MKTFFFATIISVTASAFGAFSHTASASVICPDGSWANAVCNLCPDGSWHDDCDLCPDGTYGCSIDSDTLLCPDGTWHTSCGLCPDGNFGC